MIDVGASKFSKQIHIVGVSFVETYGSSFDYGVAGHKILTILAALVMVVLVSVL